MSGVVTAVTSLSVGPVVSIIKELTGRALLVLLTLSVTLMVQLLWVPSASALKVIVLSPATEILSLLLLLQSPPYVIVPASSELKVYAGVVTLVGVGTAVTWAKVGALVSIVKGLTDRALLRLLALSVTLMVQLL